MHMENILFYMLITLIDSLYYQIDVAMHVTSHISFTLVHSLMVAGGRRSRGRVLGF